ncbi:MAG: c-type cytochrome [Planctomycetes bacterium]|nr:c-type cytochrome [Planctomycetota bacterium]
MTRRSLRLAVSLGTALALAALGGLAWLRRPRETAVMRGERLAWRLGCLGCHGPGGRGGVANPGSADLEIPAWEGGLHAGGEGEIREWILYGLPRRRWEGDVPPARAVEGAAQPAPPLAMPPYEGRLDEAELGDLVAYVAAVGQAVEALPEAARAGYLAASRLGCFGCHGPGGRGGASNPGSFKGYIPAWDGPDHGELVLDEGELRAWILDGRIPRLEANPVARYFMRRQALQMPAYGKSIEEDDLDALVVYIQYLRRR